MLRVGEGFYNTMPGRAQERPPRPCDAVEALRQSAKSKPPNRTECSGSSA